ncbi:phosphopantetheine-binding protein [Aeromonas veronii]|uniref:phosphopantetheine-binding protein n=1 Tax=Aeromonas veronii TaxID=654 RepID=UPI00187EF7E6
MIMQLEQLFSDALGIPVEQVSDVLSYQGVPQWDSVAHMGLIAHLEDHYGILLDTDDIIDMSSVAKAREILKKNGVEL